MRSYYVLVAGLVCCFLACQKEPDASLLTPASCKLDEIFYYSGGSVPEDTVSYEYTGDIVSTVNYSDYYVELSYSGDRIVKRNYFLNGTTALVAYDDLIWNGDGTLSRVDVYVADPGLPAPFLIFQYTFTYTGGKLSHAETKVDTSGTGPVPVIESYFMYTGNNISQVIQNDLLNSAADTLNYTHDANQNYYSKNPALWLSDNLFSDFNGYLLPFALSANNVTALISTSGDNIPVTYEATDQEHIKTISIEGDLLARYNYKCQ
jgi:hypothetical protein